MMTSWMIIVSRPDKVEEIRRAPDDVLSTIDAAKEVGLVFFFVMISDPNQDI
jgi:hypothetical protein